MGPLARMLAEAARRSQLIVVTHNPALIAALREGAVADLQLEKVLGETTAPAVEAPPWTWPKR